MVRSKTIISIYVTQEYLDKDHTVYSAPALDTLCQYSISVIICRRIKTIFKSQFQSNKRSEKKIHWIQFSNQNTKSDATETDETMVTIVNIEHSKINSFQRLRLLLGA